jgi:hypothetical protein
MRTTALIAVMTATTVLSGCVAFRADYDLDIRDRDRVIVKFENEQARDTFVRKMAEKPRRNFESKKEGFILGVAGGKKVTFHETDFYNYYTRLADYNGDGVITMQEAESF